MSDVCDCISSGLQTTSALIDGVYPSGMIDTPGTNWATDFFTVNRNDDSVVRIGFGWDTRFELQGVELKLFNCASEGAVIYIINVYVSAGFPSFFPLVSPPGGLIGSYLTTGDDLDCTGVTTIVIPTSPIGFSLFSYFLEFSFPDGHSNTKSKHPQNTDTAPNVPTSVIREDTEVINANQAYGALTSPQGNVEYDYIPNTPQGHTSQSTNAEGDGIELKENQAYGEIQSPTLQSHDYECIPNVLTSQSSDDGTETSTPPVRLQ